jgi:choline dehydrogenase
MSNLRGVSKIYDNWVTQYGLKGWSYEELLPFFKRSENQTNADILKKFNPYHGTGGPITVSSDINNFLDIDKDWVSAQTNNGYKYIIDANSPEFTASTVAPAQQTMRNGHRLSTSAAYLEPNRDRPNLHILTGSLATKILFNDPKNNKKTTGIEFYREGKNYTINVTKEVIISGGAINSPQLLMLSGIGPKAHLESLGIKNLVDLPVGQNLQDSAYSLFYFKIPNGFYPKNASFEFKELGLVTIENMYQYYKYGSGPLSLFNVEYSLFNTKYNNDSKGWPDSGFEAGSKPISNGKDIFITFYVCIEVHRPESRGSHFF